VNVTARAAWGRSIPGLTVANCPLSLVGSEPCAGTRRAAGFEPGSNQPFAPSSAAMRAPPASTCDERDHRGDGPLWSTGDIAPLNLVNQFYVKRFARRIQDE
jgi:hypothetical protein